MLDQFLLPLADQYESGKLQLVIITPSATGEFEALRECIAMNVASGWLESSRSGNGAFCRLTASGYLHYEPRIRALRALPAASRTDSR